MGHEHNMADGADIVPQQNMQLDFFVHMNGNVPREELRARRLAMLLDAPHEPPVNFLAVPGGPGPDPLRPRKKRSLYTMTVNGGAAEEQAEMSQLIANGMRAMQRANPNDPTDFFANYLNEHMNSENYPNGEGLPQHWGQY